MNKQEEYLQNIQTLLDHYGVKGMTMIQIAQELGVAKATLYNNFGNLRELLEALVENQTAALRDKVVGISSSHNLDPIQILVRVLELIAQSYNQRSELFLKTLRLNHPQIYTQMQSRQLRLLEEFFALNIPRGRSQGLYRNDFKTDTLASLTHQILKEIDNQWQTKNEIPFATHTQELIKFTLRSIINPTLQGRILEL